MRRSQAVGLMSLAICLAIVSSASAQGQEGRGQGGRGRGGFGFGRGGGGGLGAAMLLGNEKVQEELKLTTEQKEKLTAIREEGGGGQSREERRNLRDASAEEREKAMAEFRKRMEESNKKVEAILDPAQLKRLKEISLQVRGNAALNDEEVAKALMLTEDQVAAVKTISEESGKRMQELFQGGGGGGDREAMRKQIEELRKDTDAEYLAVLTDDQKARLTEMKGAKVEIDFQAGFGGRGGGRRRDRNN